MMTSTTGWTSGPPKTALLFTLPLCAYSDASAATHRLLLTAAQPMMTREEAALATTPRLCRRREATENKRFWLRMYDAVFIHGLTWH